MKTTLDRPTRPHPLEPGTAPSFDLAALGRELLEEPAARKSGRSAVSLVAHPGLRMVLTALKAGRVVDEHRASGPTAVTCVQGRIVLDTEGGEEELAAGGTIAFPPDALHSVRAKEDSAFLIVLGAGE